MVRSVFFAWQSDLDEDTNKRFISKALKRAIKLVNADLVDVDAMRPTQDTEGVSGSPDVAQTIFAKIEESFAFLCDISIVSRSDRRPLPNPNVMIEYGWAIAKLKDNRIITVFNEAFGNWETDRPFDMRHKRKPVTYTLTADSDKELRKVELNKLAAGLAWHLKEIAKLGAPGPVASVPLFNEFDFARSEYFKTRIPDSENGRQIGLWVAAVPFDQSLSLGRVSKQPDIWPGRMVLSARFAPNAEFPIRPMDGVPDPRSPLPSPFQAGAAQSWAKHYPTNRSHQTFRDDVARVSIRESGKIVLTSKSNNIEPPHMNMGWVLAEIANVIRIIDCIRTSTSQSIRYALSAELRYDDHATSDVYPVVAGEWRMTRLDDELGHIGTMVSSDPIILGPYEIGLRDTWSSFLGERLAELFDICGRDMNTPPVSFSV